jgi:hypothetical protein
LLGGNPPLPSQRFRSNHFPAGPRRLGLLPKDFLMPASPDKDPVVSSALEPAAQTGISHSLGLNTSAGARGSFATWAAFRFLAVIWIGFEIVSSVLFL